MALSDYTTELTRLKTQLQAIGSAVSVPVAIRYPYHDTSTGWVLATDDSPYTLTLLGEVMQQFARVFGTVRLNGNPSYENYTAAEVKAVADMLDDYNAELWVDFSPYYNDLANLTEQQLEEQQHVLHDGSSPTGTNWQKICPYRRGQKMQDAHDTIIDCIDRVDDWCTAIDAYLGNADGTTTPAGFWLDYEIYQRNDWQTNATKCVWCRTEKGWFDGLLHLAQNAHTMLVSKWPSVQTCWWNFGYRYNEFCAGEKRSSTSWSLSPTRWGHLPVCDADISEWQTSHYASAQSNSIHNLMSIMTRPQVTAYAPTNLHMVADAITQTYGLFGRKVDICVGTGYNRGQSDAAGSVVLVKISDETLIRLYNLGIELANRSSRNRPFQYTSYVFTWPGLGEDDDSGDDRYACADCVDAIIALAFGLAGKTWTQLRATGIFTRELNYLDTSS